MSAARSNGPRLSQPRSVAYWRLRVCERLRMSEQQFLELPYGQQVQYVAYELLREREEAELQGGGDG